MMKRKSVGVAKVVALAVPLGLAIVMAVLGRERRAERAEAATKDLLSSWSGDEEQEPVEELLRQGADVKARDGYGQTALHRAAYYRAPAVEILLDYGADIEAQDGSEATPLMTAVDSCNSDAVRILLSRGANANAQTAMHHTRQSALTVARDAMKKVEDNPSRLASPQQIRSAIANYREIIQMLKAAGARE